MRLISKVNRFEHTIQQRSAIGERILLAEMHIENRYARPKRARNESTAQ